MTRFIFPIIGILLFNAPAHSSTLSIAQKYMGMHERTNRAALKRMLTIDPVRVPWCAAYATFVIRKAGRKPPRSPFMARSWLRYGKPVKLSWARAGDIVVTGRHVGFFHSRSKGRVCLVGGNQTNRVQLSCYAAGRVRGVRR